MVIYDLWAPVERQNIISSTKKNVSGFLDAAFSFLLKLKMSVTPGFRCGRQPGPIVTSQGALFGEGQRTEGWTFLTPAEFSDISKVNLAECGTFKQIFGRRC